MTFSVGEFRALQVLPSSRSRRAWLAVRASDADPDTEADRAEPVVLALRDHAEMAQIEAEFRTAASASHPHLLPVLAVATATDALALVTEFAAGGSLRDRLAAETLRPGAVVSLLAALSSALAYCHDILGVVHGGLSAGRVLFAVDGRPMLAGLGAVGAAIAAGQPPLLDPGHVSPEVARGQEPQPTDDVFALGSVALQALRGTPAWPADELRDVVVQSALGQWPAPGDSCPAELGDLLEAMLAREPADRPTAAEVFRQLARCDRPEPIGAVSLVGGMPAEPIDRPAPTRPGRHASPDDDAGDGEPVGQIEPPATSDNWLDVPVGPSWSLTPDGPPEDEGSPAAPLAVTPLPAARRSVGRADRPSNRRAAQRQPEHWRRTVLTCLVAVVLAAGSVVAGLWWASSDATPGAVLPAISPPADSGATRAAVAVVGTDDWSAVITELDERRSAAFAAGDPSLLARVYASGSPALAVDADRISQLAAAGVRVEGLRHVVSSVRLLDPVTLTVEVVDSMPALPVVDGSGAVVAHTVEQPATTRVMRLTVVAGEYRIVEVTGPG